MVAIILCGRHALLQDAGVDIIGNALKTLDKRYFKFVQFVETVGEDEYSFFHEPEGEFGQDKYMVFQKLAEECKKYEKVDFIIDLHMTPGSFLTRPIQAYSVLLYDKFLAGNKLLAVIRKLKTHKWSDRIKIFDTKEFSEWCNAGDAKESEKDYYLYRNVMCKWTDLLGEKYQQRYLVVEAMVPLPKYNDACGWEAADLWHRYQKARKADEWYVSRHIPLFSKINRRLIKGRHTYAKKSFLRVYGEPMRDLLENDMARKDLSKAINALKTLLLVMKEMCQ